MRFGSVTDLPPPWGEALSLAWEAFRADTMPIGAVICDEAGTVVARGRNRTHDRTGRRAIGGLAGSRLAHAEVNAILELPLTPDAVFDDHTIYTTTEPCLLCVGAITMVRIGRVHFAASEPVAGGARELTGASPYLQERRTSVSGPVRGTVGAFARLLHEVWAWQRAPGGLVERTTRATSPELATLVEQVVHDRALNSVAARGGDLDQAMASIRDALERAETVLGL